MRCGVGLLLPGMQAQRLELKGWGGGWRLACLTRRGGSLRGMPIRRDVRLVWGLYIQICHVNVLLVWRTRASLIGMSRLVVAALAIQERTQHRVHLSPVFQEGVMAVER